MDGATRTLVVWCPDWPVAVAGKAGGAGEPLAVVAANQVVACSAAARAEGVRRGLRRREAEARCPGLTVVEADPSKEARAFEPVVAAVEAAFTPRVEVVRPGVCAFATRGPSRYFGGDEALAAQVVARVDEVVARTLGADAMAGPCRVGVADGRFAAEQAARAGHLVPPGQSAAYLAPLPAVTATGPDLGDLLGRLGVRTLGELAALPSRAVLARFGPEGTAAARLARGLEERPLAARTPPPDLAFSAELDPPADRLDTITFVARSLAASLAQALAERGLAADLVRIEAETEHGESLSRAWRVGDGGASAALAERVRWQLDGWLAAPERPSGPVTLLRLVPEEVRPDGSSQAGFWGEDRAAAERIGRVLARVQGRLGHAAVATAVVTGGRSPAEQVRLVPWGDPRPPPAAEHAAPWPGSLPLPAPATVLDAPVPAEVLDAAGDPVGVSGRGVASAPPATVSVAGGPRTPVVAWAGPWLADERWWDASAHRRRARWQVVTATGAAHLLCLEGGRWTVEATYD